MDIDEDESLDNPSPNSGAVARPTVSSGTQKNSSNNYQQHTSVNALPNYPPYSSGTVTNTNTINDDATLKYRLGRLEPTASSSSGYGGGNGQDQGSSSSGQGSGLANSQGQGLAHGPNHHRHAHQHSSNSPLHHNINNTTNNNLTTRLLTCWKGMLMTCLPVSLTQQYPWLADALPLCLVVGFVNFNTWGMVTALSPFAFKNVSTDESGGASSLALAYELGAMLLVTGDLSTTQFHLPIHIGLLAFAICTFTIYLAAGDLPLFHHPFAPHLLIASFSCGRFFEAHLVRSVD